MKNLILALTILLCASTAWGRMNALVVGGGVQAASTETTATSACIGLRAGSGGEIELLVYDSNRDLVAKTGTLTATGSSVCGNLDVSISESTGNVFLAVRHIGNGWPQYGVLGGTAGMRYLVAQSSTPDPLGSGEAATQTWQSIAIWLRDSGNALVLGSDQHNEALGTNANAVWWRGTSYAW